MKIKQEIVITDIKEEPGAEGSPKETRIKLVKHLHDTKAPNSVTYKRLQQNLRQIIEHSNATPIRRVNDLDYVCAYCEYQNPNPAELKKHTIVTHGKETVVTSTKKMSAHDLLVKLDITSLTCNLCEQNLDTLEQLLEHLQSTHSKKIHTDIQNQILPFKFGSGTLTCFICDASFPTFKMLNVHVNTHYRHYVCDVCGLGFVNPNKLGKHMLTHKTGSFICSHCFKDFATNVKMKAHVKQVHGPKLRLKCWHCDERFGDILVKEKHMTEAHGIVFPTPKCDSCDKVFIHRRALNSHIKRVHLMDRRHECLECDMKFFASAELRNHMLKHTGARHFQCEVCLKRYSRKSNLTEHMRIHANDRRFKCEHCGMTFVQKCSWRGHLRNKHGDIA